MTDKPNLTRVWAKTAPGGNVVDPDTVTEGKFAAGWQAEVPPFEYFNFIQKQVTEGLAHINEQGIAVWDDVTAYPIGALAKGSDGNIYKASTSQNNNDPVSDDGTNWKNWENTEGVIRVTSVEEIEAYSAPVGYVFSLNAGGRSGVFDVVDGDFSTELAADTLNGIYIGLSDDPTAETKVAKRRDSGVLTPEMFGAIGDGAANDTAAMTSALLQKGTLEGSAGSVYFINAGNTRLDCNLTKLCNISVKMAPNSVFFQIPNTHDFYIDGLELDGQRGTFTELWNKFAANEGVDSILPYIVQPIRSDANNNNVFISNSSFKNIFAESVILNGGNGNFYYNDLYFENIANKVIHSFHITRGVGSSFVSNVKVKGSGILPAVFNYYDGSTTESVTFGDASMPMPQGSFGIIVSFGNAYMSNIECVDYGSIAVTFDRNKIAKGDNIFVSCNDARAVSNNSSAAIWNEFCDYFTLTNWTVDLTLRSDLSFAADSCIELALGAGSVNKISKGSMSYLSASFQKRPVAMSSRGGCLVEIDGMNFNGDTVSNGPDIFHAYTIDATVKDKLYLNNIQLDGTKVSFSPTEVLSITNSNITTSLAGFQLYDPAVTGISSTTEHITFTDVIFGIASELSIIYPVNHLKIKGGKFNHDTSLSARVNDIKISGAELKGRLFIVSNYIFQMSNTLVTKRVAFSDSGASSSQFITISGCIIANDEGTLTVLIASAPITGTIVGNNILIKTGTAGAGYVTSHASLEDSGNKKATVDYFF